MALKDFIQIKAINDAYKRNSKSKLSLFKGCLSVCNSDNCNGGNKLLTKDFFICLFILVKLIDL